MAQTVHTLDPSEKNMSLLLNAQLLRRLILASIVVLFHTYELTNFATFSTFDRYLSLNFAAR